MLTIRHRIVLNIPNQSPALTYIHASETARTTAGGIVGNASKRCNAGAVTLGSVTHYGVVGGSKPTEQRAQSDACIGFAE